MNNIEFVNKAKDIAGNHKTLYVMGGLGYPLTPSRKEQCIKQYDFNAKRAAMIRAATIDTFAFDCVGLIKSIIWGWNGSTDPNLLGGGRYQCNGLSDIDEDMMIKQCKDVSTDFSKITVGEVVWIPGHIGIYIGNGLAIECTPAWQNKVQITACNCAKSGYNRRDWKKHGFLPWITYTDVTPVTPAPTKKTNEEIAREVIDGKWGNGDERKKKLEAAGYNYRQIQDIVNVKVKATSSKPKTTTVIHTVKKGDTLWAIANNYGVTVDSIVKNNNIKNPNLIHVGDKFKIIK